MELIERDSAWLRDWLSDKADDFTPATTGRLNRIADALTTLQSDKERMREALDNEISALAAAEDAMRQAGRQSEAYELGIQVGALESFRQTIRELFTTTDEATGR